MARMIYKPCSDKPKPTLIIKPTAKDLKDMETNFRVLPLFEKSSYEKARIRTLSMDLNEKLKCCWTKYKQNLEMRDHEPFRFPDVRDFHYRKYLIEYFPSERKFKFDNRMKMKAGPGVDYRGQMPIPHELLMVRGDTKSKQDRIKQRREKNEKRKVVEKKKKSSFKRFEAFGRIHNIALRRRIAKTTSNRNAMSQRKNFIGYDPPDTHCRILLRRAVASEISTIRGVIDYCDASPQRIVVDSPFTV